MTEGIVYPMSISISLIVASDFVQDSSVFR